MRVRWLLAVPVLILAALVSSTASLPSGSADPVQTSVVYGPTTKIDWVKIGQQIQVAQWYAAASEKKPATKPTGTRIQPAPHAENGSTWDLLAGCESTGNWATNSGNGFEGGVQFSHSTWVGYGGREFSEHAYDATREQQVVIAERVLAGQGWGAWPACSRKLGLR